MLSDKRIVELERKSDQDDETIAWQAQKISQHIDRIAELEQQLEQARQQMERQKDEWLSWEAKRKALESAAAELERVANSKPAALCEPRKPFAWAQAEWERGQQLAARVPDDLRARCAELANWHKTGLLSGEALKQFAESKYPGRHDALSLAEGDTARGAYALLSAAPAQPVLNIRCETTEGQATGTTSLPVIRVEAEDDGSFTAVTSYWPQQASNPMTDEPRKPFAWAYTSKYCGNEVFFTRLSSDLDTYKADVVLRLYTDPYPYSNIAAVAWAQGYQQGIEDERTSEANIGIAGFGAKVEPARQNPYNVK